MLRPETRPLQRGATMRMRAIALAILSLWICATAASGQQQGLIGPGAASCGQYAQGVRAQGAPMRNYFFAWAQGFLSGLNSPPMLVNKDANLGGRSPDDQQRFIDQYCDQRPLAIYAQ